MRFAAVLSTALLALIGADSATASEERPTLQEIEGEVYCPTCKQLLSLSSAPVADRMREFIQERIGAGDTKSAIKAQLVDEFGQAVLAAPTREGFNVLAWVLPPRRGGGWNCCDCDLDPALDKRACVRACVDSRVERALGPRSGARASA